MIDKADSYLSLDLLHVCAHSYSALGLIYALAIPCIPLAIDEIAQCLEAAIGPKFLLVRKNLLGAGALA